MIVRVRLAGATIDGSSGPAFDVGRGAPQIRTFLSKGLLVLKPGLTQELRARVNANLAADVRQRQRTVLALVIAILAVCAYFLLRWLS